jgi:hypothetical protein
MVYLGLQSEYPASDLASRSTHKFCQQNEDLRVEYRLGRFRQHTAYMQPLLVARGGIYRRGDFGR